MLLVKRTLLRLLVREFRFILDVRTELKWMTSTKLKQAYPLTKRGLVELISLVSGELHLLWSNSS